MSQPDTPPVRLGRYMIVRELGKGAMGVVYEGLDPNIGRRVAIKTARRDVLAASGMMEEMMQRFLREARAAGALNHPNIITIYDADEQDGTAYIAMEFIEGHDLRRLVEQRRRLDLAEILEIGATVCEALDAAHRKGVVHRDIKPANILLPKEGGLKIADFGIARVADSNLTQEGALIGTPHYMSPEQFMGHKVDGRADLFSVGIILYELLTGEKPFTGEALSTVMHHVIKTMPVPPSELNFSVPKHVDRVLLKAMAKRPQDRYQDGRAMAAALRECAKVNPDYKVLGIEELAAGATVSTSPSRFDPAASHSVFQPESDLAIHRNETLPPAPAPALAPLESTPPAQAAPPTGAAVRQHAAASTAPTPAGWGPAKWYAVVAVVIVAFVLFIFAWTRFGGTPGGVQEASVPPEPQRTAQAPVPSAEAYYGGVRVRVYKALDDAISAEFPPDKKWSRSELEQLVQAGRIAETSGTCTAVDLDTGALLAKDAPVDSVGSVLEWPGKRPLRLRIEVSIPNHGDDKVVVTAPPPAAAARPDLLTVIVPRQGG
jgi:serine/threonine-protein kinase